MRASAVLLLLFCACNPRSSANDDERVFQHGLADPRAGEYREIEVMTGNVWGGEGSFETRGWVLSSHCPLRAVTWSGIVYPLITAGPPADLRADVLALVALERKAHADSRAEHPDLGYRRSFTTSEHYNLSHQSATAVKVALLLRLGERALAKELRDVLRLDESIDGQDPYLLVAVDWAWNLFERAITAHLRGDHSVALASARLLAEAAPEIEAEADRRMIARHRPHVDFIEQLPALVADEQRREQLGAREKLDGKELVALTPAARVKLLIAHLDEIAVHQDGQPGGVDLPRDPIIAALITIGAPAVEPLIDVLESDRRLTRSVLFGRDFRRHRSVVGVDEAAYAALAEILGRSFAPRADERRLAAPHMRTYWAKWKSVPLEERWYRVLADDGAKPEEWLDAAEMITQDNGGWRRIRNALVTPTPGLRGEALRARAHPSVTELFIERLGDARLDVRAACDLAGSLERWDMAAAGRPMTTLIARAIAASNGTLIHSRCIAALTTALAKAGDLAAVDRYAGWLAATTPGDSDVDASLVTPMASHPTRPSVVKAGNALFRDGSPWVPLVSLAPNGGDRTELFDTKLLRVGGFNKHVARALVDTRAVGTLTMQDRGHFEVEMRNGSRSSATTEDPPPPGATQPVRVSDYYAWELAGYHASAPRFEPFWPLERRDAALVAMRAWVATQLAR